MNGFMTRMPRVPFVDAPPSLPDLYEYCDLPALASKAAPRWNSTPRLIARPSKAGFSFS
ncbi:MULTISPECIES: hypothetical protein [Deinococcus]|uniref:Uncharacterized protein n=4 Tax=Deinococcus TaxID=1298 RepID=A0A7W8KIL1_9DEIO|nr:MULTISPECIES: hypothetical protein [Deinococcus]MBB5364440.1 hypothetical protein [Deinococcus humi]MBB5378797.1 hypothetical protein [Deinococcus metalli]MBX8464386.1 hypothetical protein [Deinococcus sp. RIT780]MCD0155685.1 hypothetical protein [Deinococcus sp. 6GRE01]WDA60583.1 hypothetical protein M8445_17755 [Deinococcus aquaticus]